MTLLGVHEQYQGPKATTPVETLRRHPQTYITREFKSAVIPPQNLVKAMTNLCSDVWSAGLVCNVSFKLSPQEVLNGQWRPHVEQLAHWLVDSQRTDSTILTFWHEPEDDTATSFSNGIKADKKIYFQTAPDFVNYFNTLHGWVKGVSPKITTSHAALGYAYRPTLGGPGDKSAWVPDAQAWRTNADIHSIDIYNGRSFPLDVILRDSPAFNRWSNVHNIGVDKSSRWGVSERGWTTKNQYELRANTITAELAWLKSLKPSERPEFYIAWLTEGVEKDFGLTPDPLMSAALVEGFANFYRPEPNPEPQQPSTSTQCPLCKGTGTVPIGTYTITTTVQATHGD